MQSRPLRTPAFRRRPRHGLALVLVLACLALLGLSVLLAAELQVGEAQVISARVQLMQARLAAESALEHGAALIDENPGRTQRLTVLSREAGIVAWESPTMRGTGALIVDSSLQRTADTGWGLDDESRRFHLARLPLGLKDQPRARAILMAYPGMSLPLADALLDWLDEDDLPRPFGAEKSYYGSQQQLGPRNGLPDNIDELRRVRGMTEELFLGRSNDPRAPGLVNCFTVMSAECQQRADGTPKIPLNQADLAGLYDRVAQRFGDRAAQFIVAFRLAGPTIGAEGLRVNDAGPDPRSSAEERARLQAGDSQDETAAELSRGGLDLSLKPAYRIRTLFDLFGTSVRLTIDGKDEVLESPWTDEPSVMQLALHRLEPWLTTAAQPWVEGLVSVNTAPAIVLGMVPGCSPAVAQGIVARHPQIARATSQEYASRWSDLTWWSAKAS
jgi:type II secretory pathway component PulK